MIDRVREAAAGDPVRADEWNQLARLVNGWQAGRWRSGPPGGAGDVRVSSGLSVLVRNDTGGDLPAFVPVKLGATLSGLVATPDPLPYESRDRPLFAGEECDGGGVTAIIQVAIKENEIGPAVVMGVTVARVASGLVVGDACQPPSSGNVELVAGGSFAVLLSDGYGSGDRAAMVRIGEGGDIIISTYRTVRTSATNSGTSWTNAKLVKDKDPPPGSAATGPDIEVRPLYGAGVTVGGVTFGPHTLASGIDYPIAHRDSTTGSGGKQRYWVLPIGLVKCDAGTIKGI